MDNWSKCWLHTDVSIPQGPIEGEVPKVVSYLNAAFQFHKVQLKGVSVKAASALFERFQFHKVQLKALSPDPTDTIFIVSIPQGPIEGGNTKSPTGWCGVSIPQGPIEGKTQGPICRLLKKFQFHKVQLKGTQRSRLDSIKWVSIPQGPIEGDSIQR